MTRPEEMDDRSTGERRGADPGASSERASRRKPDWSTWIATLRDVSPYLDLGWRLMGAAAFPALLGYGVDAGLGTDPWGVLVGGALGLSAAAVQLIRLNDEFTG